jgi:Cu2+-exporting ATPase/Cu+-exporting ATPase
VTYFSENGPKLLPLQVVDVREIMGVGVSGWIDGTYCEVKRHPVLGVGVFRDQQLIGRLILSDELRGDTRSTLEQLRRLGNEVGVLSGDTRAAVEQVGREIGVPLGALRWELTPQQKAEVIDQNPNSMMVGDGANDAIALARASVSMAVQGGMEMSIRTAGIFSTVPGIAPVLEVLELSRRTMKVIRRNLVFALIYNGVGVAFALTGHLNPLAAAVLMPLSALTVFVSTWVELK